MFHCRHATLVAKVKNSSLFVRTVLMAYIHIVLLSTAPCKIIGCANGCCEG